MKMWVILMLLAVAMLGALRVEAVVLVGNGDGTVSDNRTGLTWQQGEPGQMSWGNALSYCVGLTLGGQSDWRLPNVKELRSLVDYTRSGLLINTLLFPNAHASHYWSSTTNAYYPHLAWYVHFSYGLVYSYYKLR